MVMKILNSKPMLLKEVQKYSKTELLLRMESEELKPELLLKKEVHWNLNQSCC